MTILLLKSFTMKKTTKILLISGVALLLSAGAVINFLKAAQTEAQVSDLTLANIEALALDPGNGEKPIVLPCCPGEKTDVCIFEAVYGDGSQGTVELHGVKNC